MERFDLGEFKLFADLPIKKFNLAGYSIYVLDKNWNYLFVNDFVLHNLGDRAKLLIGKNMWDAFPEFTNDSAFRELKENTEQGIDSNLVTISPVTEQRINIKGKPLEDCFIFTSSILPKKEDVIGELRKKLGR